MNFLNGSYWPFLSTVTLHPTHTTHSLLHSSLTTYSIIVSVPLLPQIRVGSSHLISVHIILDDPAGNSYIQVAALHPPLTHHHFLSPY